MKKKLFYGILIIILSLSIFSCNAKTAGTEEEAFDIVIKELNTDQIV